MEHVIGLGMEIMQEILHGLLTVEHIDYVLNHNTSDQDVVEHLAVQSEQPMLMSA